MHPPAPLRHPETAFASFDLVSFGELRVPREPMRLGFQVDIVPAESPREIFFGLVAPCHHGHHTTSGPAYGFAIRLDLTTGEIWDMVNGSGLIGWVEDVASLEARHSDEEPLLLSWEVEHLGTALIPRLHIGEEEWLYPALPYREDVVMQTLAGGAGDFGSTQTAFLHPALWRELF